MKLQNKVALITGAGRGIGKGCALQLAMNGAEVVINDRPGSTDLQATADEIRSLGGVCHPIAADVFSRSGCEELFSQMMSAVGRVDILADMCY